LLPDCGSERPSERIARPPASISTCSEPGHAVQLLLVGALDAELADVVGALVVGELAARVDALHVGVVDAADVADRVRRELPLRIGAEDARLDLEAREAEAVHREARDLLFGQPCPDRQALEVLAFFLQLAEAAAVAGRHVDHLRELVDGALDVAHAAGRHLERVRRVVGGEHLAVAVVDDPAVGDDGNHRDAVRLGQRVVVLALHDLQPREAAHQQREGREDEESPRATTGCGRR
jgi:hypothetical protein